MARMLLAANLLVQSMVMVPLGLYIIWQSARPWLCLANGLLFHVIAFGAGINVVLRGGAPEEVSIAFNLVGALVVPLAISSAIDHPRGCYKKLA